MTVPRDYLSEITSLVTEYAVATPESFILLFFKFRSRIKWQSYLFYDDTVFSYQFSC